MARKDSPPWLGIGIVASLAIACLVAVGLLWNHSSERGQAGGTRPKTNQPAKVQDDWTHAELASHLKKNGVSVSVRPAGLPHTSRGLPVARFWSEDESATIVVYLSPDTKTAKEQTGTMGAGAFTCGRFSLGIPHHGGAQAERDAELLRSVASVLN